MSNIAISELPSEATSVSNEDLLLVSKKSLDGTMYTSMKLKANNLKNSLITIDNALSSTSTNPVQNKVINDALVSLQNSIQLLNKEIYFMNLDSIIIPYEHIVYTDWGSFTITEDSLYWINTGDINISTGTTESISDLENAKLYLYNSNIRYAPHISLYDMVLIPKVTSSETEIASFRLKYKKVILSPGTYTLSKQVGAFYIPLSKCRLPNIPVS